MKIQKEIENHSSGISEMIPSKELELNAEKKHVAIFMEFIGKGQDS